MAKTIDSHSQNIISCLNPFMGGDFQQRRKTFVGLTAWWNVAFNMFLLQTKNWWCQQYLQLLIPEARFSLFKKIKSNSSASFSAQANANSLSIGPMFCMRALNSTHDIFFLLLSSSFFPLSLLAILLWRPPFSLFCRLAITVFITMVTSTNATFYIPQSFLVQ